MGCGNDFLIRKQIVNSNSKIAKLKASMVNGVIIFNRAREHKGTDLVGAPTLHWVLPDLPGVIPKHCPMWPKPNLNKYKLDLERWCRA